MKKISSRKATSTIGVMSMLTPMRRFFLSMSWPLLAFARRRREQLDRLVRGFVHHVVEVVDARHEHVVRHDACDGDDQPAGRVDERFGNTDGELGRIDGAGVT